MSWCFVKFVVIYFIYFVWRRLSGFCFSIMIFGVVVVVNFVMFVDVKVVDLSIFWSVSVVVMYIIWFVWGLVI